MKTETAYAFCDQAMISLTKNGAFLTSGGKKDNAMTIGWGSIGMMWGKPVFFVPVRLSRYTLEQIDVGRSFGVSVPALGEMTKELGICGSKSGRDMDKFAEIPMGKKKAQSIEIPLVEGCKFYYECIVRARYEASFFAMDEAEKEKWYPAKPYRDPHVIFAGEIVEAYQKD